VVLAADQRALAASFKISLQAYFIAVIAAVSWLVLKVIQRDEIR
jgi:hypothetical protein